MTLGDGTEASEERRCRQVRHAGEMHRLYDEYKRDEWNASSTPRRSGTSKPISTACRKGDHSNHVRIARTDPSRRIRQHRSGNDRHVAVAEASRAGLDRYAIYGSPGATNT